MAGSRRTDELSDRADCVYGSRHLPTRFYTTPLGEKLACIDWQDQAPGPDGKYHPHRAWDLHQRKPCRVCGRLSMLSDCRGRPCHKVCAEQEWARGAACVEKDPSLGRDDG